MQDTEHAGSKSLVSKRTLEIVVALAFLVVAGIVINDSLRLGMGWGPDGPEAGYFPFYMATAIAVASLYNLYQAAFRKVGAGQRFVSRSGFVKVITVLVPLLIYVACIRLVGIYVASAVYIALFMWYFGKYAIWYGLPVGAAIAGALFFMFEVWFLVPLPKGPLEAYLGY
jgi:hypothetical protein